MIRYVVGCFLLSASISSRADSAAQAIALNCLTCHDHDVAAERSESEIPSLRGISREALQKALLDFKYERRPATLMPRIAKGYSDDDLAAVAGFLASH